MRSFPSALDQSGTGTPDIASSYLVNPQQSGFDVSRLTLWNTSLTRSIRQQLYSRENMNISEFSRYENMISIGDNKTESTHMTMSVGNVEQNTRPSDFENPARLSAEVLSSINKYRKPFKAPVNSLIDWGKTVTKTGGKVQNVSSKTTTNTTTTSDEYAYSTDYNGLKTAVVRATFNPAFMIQVVGMTDNIPLLNDVATGSLTADWQSEVEASAGWMESQYKQLMLQAQNAKAEMDSHKKSSYYSTYVKNYNSYVQSMTNLRQAYKNIVKLSTDGNNKMSVDPKKAVLTKDITNCSTMELIKKSHKKNSILGMGRYRYADFIMCKDFGKVSNNHLITLRKFNHPVGDNIFRMSAPKHRNSKGELDFSSDGDAGRLITWFGTEDNKLEDIMKYSVQATWKEFQSKIQEIESKEDDSAGGIIGMLTNSLNPSYTNLVGAGMAGQNSIWPAIGGKLFGGSWGGLAADNGGMNSNGMDKWRLMRMSADNNRIYTPKNTIQATHMYEGKLILEHEVTLNFSYRLRVFTNQNPKTMMLDLLGNILEVTYRRGKFWGGARRFIGPPRNTAGWKKANAMIDNVWDKLGGFMKGLAEGNIDWQGIMASVSQVFSNVMNAAKDTFNKLTSQSVSTTTQDLAQGIININKKYHFSNALKGMLKNKLGRPAIYAMDSLLSGDNVGLWHITIGNPKNPIAAFGNMIMTKATISHSGPLGVDDFPTELKVSCSLKHGRSRDLTEISRMYTKGTNTFYNAIDKNKLKEFVKSTSEAYQTIQNGDGTSTTVAVDLLNETTNTLTKDGNYYHIGQTGTLKSMLGNREYSIEDAMTIVDYHKGTILDQLGKQDDAKANLESLQTQLEKLQEDYKKAKEANEAADKATASQAAAEKAAQQNNGGSKSGNQYGAQTLSQTSTKSASTSTQNTASTAGTTQNTAATGGDTSGTDNAQSMEQIAANIKKVESQIKEAQDALKYGISEEEQKKWEDNPSTLENLAALSGVADDNESVAESVLENTPQAAHFETVTDDRPYQVRIGLDEQA